MADALGPKGIELLREVLPGITRMAALYQGDNPGAVVIVDEVERKGAGLGLRFVRLPVHDPSDYAAAFETASREKSEALFIMDDGAITKHRQQILDLEDTPCRWFPSTGTSRKPVASSLMAPI
jgi:ABC-type uncharacterized transport system substrate-binding protein